MKIIVPILAVAMLLLARSTPAPKPADDHRSQVAAWMAYYAVNTPTPVPKPTPKVETPKPAPAKPKVELNVFGRPIEKPKPK